MTQTAQLRAPEPSTDDSAAHHTLNIHTYRAARAPSCPDDTTERAKSLLLADLRDFWNELRLERREIASRMAEIEAVGRWLRTGKRDDGDIPFTVKDALDYFGAEFIIWLTRRKLERGPIDSLVPRESDGA